MLNRSNGKARKDLGPLHPRGQGYIIRHPRVSTLGRESLPQLGILSHTFDVAKKAIGLTTAIRMGHL
jgi:hypothetical protein